MTTPANPLTALGRRTAVFVGALTALLSLFGHVPVQIACLRGAGAWFATLFLCGVFRSLLQLSLQADRAQRDGGRT